MSKQREALKMALRVLENTRLTILMHNDGLLAIAAIQEALAQPEPEPVAWMDAVGGLSFMTPSMELRPYWKPLYLHSTPIPEGWQLVPIEATIEMSDAFFLAYIECPEDFGSGQSQSVEDFHDFRYMYKDMLAAAPKPEE